MTEETIEAAETYHVIGGGISGLMTALRASEAGHSVVILSNTPDPRTTDMSKEHGSTYGGGPTRMATSTEGDVYLGNHNPIYPNMIQNLFNTVSEGGWLDRPYDELEPAEKQWIAQRQSANDNDDYTKALSEFYFKVNKKGVQGWFDLKEKYPNLFEGCDFVRSIQRTYDKKEKLDFAVQKYTNAGELQKVYYKSTNSLPSYFLKKKSAGLIEIDGCSFNVQQLMKNLLNHLESQGVNVMFNTALQKIELNEDKQVQKLKILRDDHLGKNKSTIENPKYVSLHMGAYDNNNVLDNTPAKDSIMGVSGLWMKIPKPEGMKQSMKVHISPETDSESGTKKPLMDLNLIINGDDLIVGSGYIFTGTRPTEISDTSKQVTHDCMKACLKNIIKDLKDEDIEILAGECTRSFSNTDLPLLKRMATARGGYLTITGGENTGTTSMAPTMSELTVRTTQNLNATNGLGKIQEEYQILKDKSQTLVEQATKSSSPLPFKSQGKSARKPTLRNNDLPEQQLG